MSQDTRKAEALRDLADAISNGIPGLEYHAVPLVIGLFFRTEADRQNAIDAFKRDGHNTVTDTAGNITTHIGGDHLSAGLSIALIVPTIDFPDSKETTE